jgi:tape measure domain-containing protein
MSSKIDERIVGMKFNGDQFQKGVADTSSALDKLKKALNLDGAAKGLNDLDSAGKNFSLSGLANGVQDIAGKFGALSIIGITALANIANKAVDAGLTIMRSLTIDPVKAGFAEYELKMGSIQTILANTARYGTQLPEVVANLDQLNNYADKTIYNFGDMTKNIGLFTNAGIKIGDATSMIKGFSNEAAASGTNAQGAASAAYQLSQALSAGTIRLMDWRSLQNVGMGNKNMQNGLIEIAQAMGSLNQHGVKAIDIQKDFNGSLEKNWLSADVMSSYLKIMAGDMDVASQKALGLSDAQIQAFSKQQKMSEDAATKVRTFTQLLGTMQESVGSGWTETFDLLIGNFNDATDLWTGVNDELGGLINGMAQQRNDLLRAFVNGGGRKTILDAFSNIWQAFKSYVMPIKDAWESIFPPITVQNLQSIAQAFLKITEAIKPSKKTMDELGRIFKGVFAVLDIGRMIIVEVWGVLMRLFGAASQGAGGFLEVAANVGDFLVKVRDAIKYGTALEMFFKGLGDVLQWPIDKLRELGAWTIKAVSTWDLAKAWEAVANAFQKIGQFLGPVWTELGNFFRDAKKVLTDFFKSLDFNVLVGLMNFGALAAIGVGLKKAFDFFRGGGIMALIFGDKGDKGPGLVDTIKKVFGAITDTFAQLQNTLKSATLIGIGIAIALITASVVALSFVDTGKLFTVLGAMSIMFGQLSAMLLAIDKLTSKTNPVKMIATGIALATIAAGMLIMSTAILILSTMSWEELARGLAGMAIGLGLLVGASALLGKMSGRLIFAAPAIVLISGAMLILAGAMKIFSTMSWDDILRAGTTLAAALGIMVGAMTLVHSKVFAAASMVVLAVAVNILAGAMKVFSTMSWDDILRAGVAMAAAVGIMVGAMALLQLMGPMMIVGAASMVIGAAALTIVAGAMKVFSTMSWDEIGRGLVAMAGGLAILAGAMALMGIPLVALGGLALAVAAAGMMMLAPALLLMGSMSWDAIGLGLALLGASLGILAVGGLLMIPASVGFLLLGAALLMIGGAVMLAGQGIGLFAAGFTALVAAATLGAPAIKTALETIASAIPAMLASFAQGIIDFALVIANGGTAFTLAMSTLIGSLLTAINERGPQVIDTLANLLMSLLTRVEEDMPKWVEKGSNIIISFLNGIAVKLPDIINAAANLIVAFLNGLSREMPRIGFAATTLIIAFINTIQQNANRLADAGMNAIIAFVNGLANSIRTNTDRMRAAGLNLAEAIIDGMTGGLFSGIGKVINAAKNVASNALNSAKKFLGINSPSKEFFKVGSWSSEGMAIGLEKSAPMVTSAAENVADGALTAMQKSLSNLKNAVATDMEFAPTIRPVLDLSNVQKNSALIGGMLTPPTLKVDDSYAYASSIATSQRDSGDSTNDGSNDGSSGDTYIFNQTNNSPKALTPAEIYRQTNNQLSVVKKGQPSA